LSPSFQEGDGRTSHLSILHDYQDHWSNEFARLRSTLERALGDLALNIHHIGSTSIPGMPAKPILDIDIEIPQGTPIESVSERLRPADYRYRGTQGIPDRHVYKPQSPRGWMAHHLYVLPEGARVLKRDLHFRDSLVASPELHAEYRRLKQRCASAAGSDRKAYQAAKESSPFFERVHALPPIREAVNGGAIMLERLESRLAAGEIDENEWFRAIERVITPVYLAANNPRAQSGHSGDEARWTHARSLIAEAINRDGTLLDIGCASGYLMESIQQWAHARGFAIEPYGLEIAPELADLARRRLPHWAGRIHTGNALFWRPGERFAFVRTGLEYVPMRRRQDFIEHLLNEVVAPGGRLIIGTYNEVRASTGSDLEQMVASWGFAVSGRTRRPHRDSRLEYKVFWIDAGPTPHP
jgi:GrpB-like predicted nucleotidyltransferase (UPF0157 family)